MDLDAFGELLDRLTSAVERLADAYELMLSYTERATRASEEVTASILRNEQRFIPTNPQYVPPVDPLKGRR